MMTHVLGSLSIYNNWPDLLLQIKIFDFEGSLDDVRFAFSGDT